MKKLITLLALIALSVNLNAQSKIGTIDADYILAQMPEMAEVNEGMEAYGKELQADLDSTITQYETLGANYQENRDSLTEQDRKSQEGELISLENDIQGFRQKASVMMQMKRNELTEPLYETINNAMLSVIQEEGFTQVFHSGSNALAFSAEGFDITLKVLEELGITVESAPEEE